MLEQEMNHYLLERRLKEQDPALHSRFKDTAVISIHMLSSYRRMFPEYTDHSELHSLTVIEGCNRLIGAEQIEKLNKDEIYILLMACYLHDAGMGINETDYDEFKDRLDAEEYFANHPDDTVADFMRSYHNELSGFFIEKYSELFEFPSPEYMYAVKQVARGHRKTDLFDEREYPTDYQLPNGCRVCLPYLASLIRLADEIDVAASRNPLILYDLGLLTDEKQIYENRLLMAVKSVETTDSAFILLSNTDDEDLFHTLEKVVAKMQKTLDYCREVINIRTGFRIHQSQVVLKQK